MGEASPRGKSRYSDIRPGKLDTVAARRSLIDAAKQAARDEDSALKAEGLHIGSSDEKVASYRGVGLGLYFKVMHWLFWMMIWMMFCSVPYLIAINTSVFTDYAHRHDHGYGVKVYDSFELSSFTFAAIVDDKKDNGTLQYMNTDIADAWKGPMQKGVFLTWISLMDAGATVVLTGIVVVLFRLVRQWLEKVDYKTREVSDYAVIVGGLPPYVTATEVGEYFEKHFSKEAKTDKVMDVVLIRGFSKVVHACKEVHRNEQLKRFVAGMEGKLNTVNSTQLPAAAEATAAADADREDAGLVAKLAGAPVPPLSPAAAGPKIFNLTAFAAGAAGAAPPPPSPARPPAGPVAEATVATAAASLEDPEAGTLVESSSMTRDMSREMAKVEASIREQQDSMVASMREGKLRSNAAIVTLNTEQMRVEVCERMPSSWWSSLLMPRTLRLEHGGRQWRLWVRRASPPDDYRFENMSTRIRTNICIQVFTGLIMFALIVVCAAFITWLSAESGKEARLIKWDMTEMLAAIGIGMAKTNSASPSAGQSKASYDAFCSSSMPSCVAYVGGEFPGTTLNLTYGAEWSFPNATARLLNERPVRQNLIKCAESASCPASHCMPCYCLGLSSVPTDAATPEFLTHLKDACSGYWQPFDLRREGIQVAISVVIAVINSLLTFILRLLKFHVEKHWTTTDTELSYAVWSYLVKLINSVVVLLVVNCSTLGKLQKRALAAESGWVQRLVLDGLFDDFTPNWYASVGFSVLILMMINVAGPLIRVLLDMTVKWALRVRLLYGHMGKLAAPEDYNATFRSQQFTLETRISDVLFNVTLALIFGSGMPLCYLIAAAYLLVAFWWDRLQLLTWHQPAQRYQKHLPRVIMYLLPVLLLAHCAFGLWMHTYFTAELSSMDLVAAASSGLATPGISTLSHNSIGRRITQPNGLALLIWLLVLGCWLLFGRWIIRAAEKLLGGPCARLAALLRPSGDNPAHEQSDVTYEEALSTVKVTNMLRGARTYRIHHLTNYKPFLVGGAAGKLWAMAQGDRRFTRLTTFCVHVEMEVNDGHRTRTEQREVEMFDVAATAITWLPNAAAALAAVNAAAAAAAEARDDDHLPSTPQLPLPPAPSSRSASQQLSESSLRCMSPPPPPPSPPRPTAEPSADPALQSLVPSAELQSATLQQVATLQANTGVLVTRVSLRALPDGLLLPGVHGAAAVVVPPPVLPAFELDLQPVLVRSAASLRLLPTTTAQRHHHDRVLECARGSGSGDGSSESGDRDRVGDAAAVMTDSDSILRIHRSASAASATSSHVSAFTTKSAPAMCPADGSGSNAAAAGVEITAADKEGTDGGATEAAIVVQAEAIVLAEAVAVAAVGSKAAVIAAARAKGKTGLGGSFGGSGIPSASSLKARAAAVGPVVRSAGGVDGTASRESSGPRARASFKYGAAKPSTLEQLAKQQSLKAAARQQGQQLEVAKEVLGASAVVTAGDAE